MAFFSDFANKHVFERRAWNENTDKTPKEANIMLRYALRCYQNKKKTMQNKKNTALKKKLPKFLFFNNLEL